MNYSKKDWRVLYSTGTRKWLRRGNWALGIPAYPHSLHYVTTSLDIIHFGKRIPNSAKFNITLQVTASEDWLPGFKQPENNFDGAIAYTRAFILRDMYGASKRWWFPSGIPLINGVHTISAPIKPAYWTNVYGKPGNLTKNHIKSFNDCWTTPARIGVTFDGQSSYGHGVYARAGSCSVELISCIIK